LSLGCLRLLLRKLFFLGFEELLEERIAVGKHRTKFGFECFEEIGGNSIDDLLGMGLSLKEFF